MSRFTGYDEVEAGQLKMLVGRKVRIEVLSCDYQCCGRGWEHRSGWFQDFDGVLSHMPDGWLLTGPGISGVSWFVRFTEDELLSVAVL